MSRVCPTFQTRQRRGGGEMSSMLPWWGNRSFDFWFFYQINTTLSFCVSKSFLHLFGAILRIFNALCNFSYNLSSSDLILRCFSARSEFCKNLDKYYQKLINIEFRPLETIFDLKELLISLSQLPGKLSKNRHYKKKE